MALQGFRRLLAALACVIVGGASFALSFVALRDVSVALQAVPAGLGWLVPIVIDGGVICGSAVIWSLSREQVRRPVFPFIFVAALVVVSVVVNASHAGPAPLAKLIASLPPLILLGTLELVAAQGRRQHLETRNAGHQLADSHIQPAATNTPSQADSRPQVTTSDLLTPSGAKVPPAASTPFLKPSTPSPETFPEESVIEIAAAVEEVFEPGWVETSEAPANAYNRPSSSRRKPTRVRAEQPLG